jgi:hypothetical protein
MSCCCLQNSEQQQQQQQQQQQHPVALRFAEHSYSQAFRTSHHDAKLQQQWQPSTTWSSAAQQQLL